MKIGKNYKIDILGATPGSLITATLVPPGMTLSSADRTISGIPTTEGTYEFSLEESLNGVNRTSNVSVLVNPYEAVMDPPNTTLRSTYSLTKQPGIAIDVPSEMYNADGTLTGNGVYWPGASCIHVPVAAYPNRRLAFFSPDHGPSTGPTTGIYLSVCVGDPGVATNWKLLVDAWPLGWVPELTSAPTSNIVFKGATGSGQPETPWVQRVTDPDGSNPEYIMTYQTTGGTGKLPDGSTYGQQCTLRAASLDGFNWSGNLNAFAYTPVELGGPSHTGYLRWAKNELFTEVPFNYIGFGLGGLYGCDDPRVDEPMTLISRTAYQGVRYVGGLTSGWSLQKGRYDPTTAVMTQQGISIIVHIGAETAGAGVAAGSLYEALIAPDGVEILAKPQAIISQGANSTDPDRYSTGLGSMFPWGDKYVVMYEGAGNTDGTGTKKRALLATGERRNPLNTVFNPLDAPTPALETMRRRELSFQEGLPAGVTTYITGTPTISYDPVKGAVIDLKDGDKVVFVEDMGFAPSTTSFVDFLVRDYSVLSTDAYRIPWMGFTADPGHLADMQDVRALTFDPTDPTKKVFYKRTAGSEVVTLDNDTTYESAHPGYGAGSNLAKIRKDIGMRWFPQSSNNGAVRMVWGGAETASLSSVMDFANATRAKKWHRFIAFEGKGVTQVAVRGWRLREYDTSNLPGSEAEPEPTVATTFDPNAKSGAITLSEGNMTASANTGTLNAIRGARVTHAVSAGRVYMEARQVDGRISLGVVNASFGVTSGVQGTANSVICQSDGDVQKTDGTQTSVAALNLLADNDIRTMMFDIALGKIWFGRIQAGGTTTVWDGDPSAGTGGYALPSAGGALYAWSDMYVGPEHCKVTANFGATPFIGTVPTGAVSYNAAASA